MDEREEFIQELIDKFDAMIEVLEERTLYDEDFARCKKLAEKLREELEYLI
jgi:hypothetical protein